MTPARTAFRINETARRWRCLLVSGATSAALACYGPTCAEAATGSAGDMSPPTLNNLSVRTALTAGQTLTVGAVVSNGPKRILVRAAGPALNKFGLVGMVDPQLQLYTTGPGPLVGNDDWDVALAPVCASVGAFPFDAGSKDAALSQSLNNSFTVQAGGANAGAILVEAYDVAAATDPAGARLVNLSARNRVGTGGDLLIAGFSIGGAGTKLLLIRGIGSGLAQFGVSGALADPKIQLFDSAGTLVAANDNWDASLASTFAALGAFALTPNSRDAALLVTLRAGQTYTVQVSGADGGTGEALVEVYEVVDPRLGFAAPAVIAVAPAIEAAGVGLNAPISATFSAPMSFPTVTIATFTVKNAVTGAAVAGTTSVSGYTATFTPAASLAANTTYVATLNTGVKDYTGTPLATNFSWSFATGTTASGFSLQLQQGTYWEFYWDENKSTFAQGSSGSSSSTSGMYRITLGAPITIEGVQAFPVVLSGQIPTSAGLAPRWKHLAFVNGVFRGSTDGRTLGTILNPASGTMTSGGFFATFSSTETIRITNSTFTGSHNTLKDIQLVSHSSSSGGTMVIGDVTIYHDSSTEFSESESYKSGIGPVSLKRSTSYSSSGGGFYTSSSTTQTVELVATTLLAADGTPIKAPAWQEVAPMVTGRKGHAAAVHNGRIYVFGGTNSSNTALSSVEIYNPTANTWSAGTAPRGVTLTGGVARTVGNKIHLMPATATEPVRIYDPALDNWTTGANGVYTDPSHDGDVVAIGTGASAGNYIVMVTPGATTSISLMIHAYRPSDNQWLRGVDDPTFRRFTAVTAVGGDLYTIGGSALSSTGVTGLTRKYNLATNAWSASLASLAVPRYDGKAVTLYGEPIMLGGYTPSGAATQLTTVEAFSPVTGTWRQLAPMLRKRQSFAAVVLDGKIYVLGGRSGTATLNNVEVFTP